MRFYRFSLLKNLFSKPWDSAPRPLQARCSAKLPMASGSPSGVLWKGPSRKNHKNQAPLCMKCNGNGSRAKSLCTGQGAKPHGFKVLKFFNFLLSYAAETHIIERSSKIRSAELPKENEKEAAYVSKKNRGSHFWRSILRT